MPIALGHSGRVVSISALLLLAGVGGCNSTMQSVSSAFNGGGDIITFSNRARATGVKAYEEGRIEDAAGAFRNATSQNPRDYVSFYYPGAIYAKQGREQLAAQAFTTSLQVQPQTDAGRSDKVGRTRTAQAFANFLALAESRESELTRFERSVHSSNTATGWYALAMIYAQCHDADAAIDAYNRALLLAGDDFEINKSYGLYLAALSQRERAIPVLVKAYQLDQTDGQVITALKSLNIVPGPSLLTADQMARPFMPKGPLPEIEVQVRDRNAPSQASGAR